jgi:hypothetical protein
MGGRLRPHVVGGAVLILTALITAILSGQDARPVYLQYEGYIKNPDGTFVLSFGYFSSNEDPVVVAPGRENFFVPSPVDRGQPTTFLPGRHRFACTMVVESERERQLQWSLVWGGRTSRTTDRGLDPRYALDPTSAKRALRGVNLAAAPRGVCLNHPPAVHVQSRAGRTDTAARPGAASTGSVVAELELQGEVIDDGLPRGSKVSTAWMQVSGPAAVTFVDPTNTVTRARFSAFGAYEVALLATDSQLSDRAIVKIALSPGAPAKP